MEEANLMAVDLSQDDRHLQALEATQRQINREASVELNGSHNQSELSVLDLDIFEAFELGYLRHSTHTSVILSIAYSMIFVIGIIGNSFVVYIVCKSPRMRTVTNYFIANLALADILVLLFCLPATLIGNLFIPYVLGQFVCKTVSYLQGVAVSASINTMVTVTMDRFLAICFPMDWHMSRRTARQTIACIWLFSLTISMPWAIYFTLVPYQLSPDSRPIAVCAELWPSEHLGTVYFVCANLILLYLFPAVVIILCYLGIWYKIERRNIPGDRPKGLKIELIMQKSKLKVVKMMMVVVVIFLLSWLPLYMIFARIKLGSEDRSPLEEWLITNLMPLAQWLGSSNSCINPILYTFFNRKYKRGFIDLLRFTFCCKPMAQESRNSVSSLATNNQRHQLKSTNQSGINSDDHSIRQLKSNGNRQANSRTTGRGHQAPRRQPNGIGPLDKVLVSKSSNKATSTANQCLSCNSNCKCGSNANQNGSTFEGNPQSQLAAHRSSDKDSQELTRNCNSSRQLNGKRQQTHLTTKLLAGGHSCVSAPAIAIMNSETSTAARQSNELTKNRLSEPENHFESHSSVEIILRDLIQSPTDANLSSHQNRRSSEGARDSLARGSRPDFAFQYIDQERHLASIGQQKSHGPEIDYRIPQFDENPIQKHLTIDREKSVSIPNNSSLIDEKSQEFSSSANSSRSDIMSKSRQGKESQLNLETSDIIVKFVSNSPQTSGAEMRNTTIATCRKFDANSTLLNRDFQQEIDTIDEFSCTSDALTEAPYRLSSGHKSCDTRISQQTLDGLRFDSSLERQQKSRDNLVNDYVELDQIGDKQQIGYTNNNLQANLARNDDSDFLFGSDEDSHSSGSSIRLASGRGSLLNVTINKLGSKVVSETITGVGNPEHRDIR